MEYIKAKGKSILNSTNNLFFWKKKYDRIPNEIRKYEINENNYYNECKAKEANLTIADILNNKEDDPDFLKLITKSPLSIMYFLEELNSKRSKYINMDNHQYQKVSKIFRDICDIIYTPVNNIIDNKEIHNGSNSFETYDFKEEQHNIGDNKLPQWEPLRTFDRNKNVIDMFIEYPETITRLKKYIFIIEYLIILSQTFYGMVDGKRESLLEQIKECEIWNDKLIWELMIINQILIEKQRQEDILKGKLSQEKMETIETTTLVTYLFNLDNFGKSHLKESTKNDIFQFSYITSINYV
jgi:hypothetical protein